jgi:hypothetical protein
MKTANFAISACRYCRYYNSQGRRGGVCEQLGVPVQANWKACALAVTPFAPPWDSIEEIMLRENTLALKYSKNCPSLIPCETEEKPITKQVTIA